MGQNTNICIIRRGDMAIEVKVPKDIKEYKEKVIAGMNLK